MRIVHLTSGCGPDDYNCTLIVVPDDMDLKGMKALWDVWYHSVYCPALREWRRYIPDMPIKKAPEYLSFEAYLKQSGARDVTEQEVEEFYEG